MGRDFYELTDKERFLLTIFAYLPNLPVKAKDLFYLLDIKGEDLVEWFDALHNLTEDWLEYKDEHYIISSEKAHFLRNEIHNTHPVDLIIEKLKRLYENPFKTKKEILEYYEPLVLSLMKFYKEKNLSLANLIYFYARSLQYMRKKQQADLFYKQAINYLQEFPKQFEDIKQIKIANIWAELGANKYSSGNLEQAFLFANKALDTLKKAPTHLTKEFDYLKAKAIAYKIIGSYLISEKKYSQAISYLLRTIETINLDYSTSFFLAETHLWTAYSYFKLNDLQNGFKHLEKAEKILKQYNLQNTLLYQRIQKLKQFYSSLQQIRNKFNHYALTLLKISLIIFLLALLVLLLIHILK